MKKRDAITVLILLLVAAFFIRLFFVDLFQTFRLQGVQPVGTIVVKRNTVQRRLSDRVLWDRLANSSPVYVGDLIRVADNSQAMLEIDENTIYLDENTLIRIMLSPDGTGIIIELSSGSVSIIQAEGSRSITLEMNGMQMQTKPDVVLSMISDESGSSIMMSETQNWSSGLETQNDSITLFSPEINSTFRYAQNLPAVNFRWSESSYASSYIIHVSSSHEFDSYAVNREVATAYHSAILGDGLWYWRIIPVYPSEFIRNSNYSGIYFFSVVQDESINADLDFSSYLASVSPFSSPLPDGVPLHLVPARFLPPEPVPPSPAPRAPAAPSVPDPLPAVGEMSPAGSTGIGYEELRSARTITFNWSQVTGANAYVFTLFHETEDERRIIVQSDLVIETSYEYDDLNRLDKGNFIWQIEAVRVDRNNNIVQRGTVTENSFFIDFPAPSVFIEDVGVFYVD